MPPIQVHIDQPIIIFFLKDKRLLFDLCQYFDVAKFSFLRSWTLLVPKCDWGLF